MCSRQDRCVVCNITHFVTAQSVYTWQRIINILRLDSGTMLVTHFCSVLCSACAGWGWRGHTGLGDVTQCCDQSAAGIFPLVTNQRRGISRVPPTLTSKTGACRAARLARCRVAGRAEIVYWPPPPWHLLLAPTLTCSAETQSRELRRKSVLMTQSRVLTAASVPGTLRYVSKGSRGVQPGLENPKRWEKSR